MKEESIDLASLVAGLLRESCGVFHLRKASDRIIILGDESSPGIHNPDGVGLYVEVCYVVEFAGPFSYSGSNHGKQPAVLIESFDFHIAEVAYVNILVFIQTV